MNSRSRFEEGQKHVLAATHFFGIKVLFDVKITGIKIEGTDAMTWEKAAQDKFQELIAKIPVFLRDTAEKRVSQRAETISQKDGRTEVSEKDMVDAFFAETPFGFHGLMKGDMDAVGLDYRKYGY